ncbi:MAG: hypothetical protein HPAVJP_0200 [Candidatus Hepatoplasma vulgare]|nr:MAG: hypothetical protein HPAVJP_0200 [Candidatus Hepatoplasma sp.]
MKQNYLYKTKINYLDTQKAMSMIEEEILDILKNKLNVLKIRTPKYFNELDFGLERSEYKNSRNINFDSISDYKIYKLYNDYSDWFYNKLINLNIKNNNGIFSQCNYIVRDEHEFGLKTFERNEIIIYFKYENIELAKNKILELLLLFFDEFRNLKIKLNQTFKELEDVYPKFVKILDLNKEEKVKLKKNSIEDIKSYYLQRNMWNIFTYDLSEKNKRYSLSIYIDKLKKVANIIEARYFEDLDVNYFKINMNLDLIYMTFLEKLFIYEIQENINNANIQKILAENKINNI